MFIKLSPYLIAMSIGLMIGIEREQHHTRGRQAMGVRSFLLLGLFGALSSGIGEPLVALMLTLFAAAATITGYIRTTKDSSDDHPPVGLTTEIAAMITFCLGYLANIEPILSLVIGVIVLVVLLNKGMMHGFIREKLKPSELQACATLILLAVGVIPLIPDRTIDPFNIFNPQRLAVIIALIAGIQFLGYAASRVLGHHIAMPLSGFLAGNVSSTAAFLSYPEMVQKKPASYLMVASAAVFSIMATITKLCFLLSIISWQLTFALMIPLSCIIATCMAIGLLLSLKNTYVSNTTIEQNPLSLKSAIRLGVLLTFMIFMVELSERYFGTYYTRFVTFLGGLFELHGVSVANANMFLNNTLSLEQAAQMVLLAVVASMASKLILTVVLAKGAYRRLMVIVTSGLLLLSVLFWLIVHINEHLLMRV